MPVGAHQSSVPGLSRIAVIGIGGTGCALLPLLASLPVEAMSLIDGDTVEERNLSRQLLFTKADVGRPKVTAAAARSRTNFPAMEWREEFCFIDAGNCAGLLRGHVVVADCTDDLLVRSLIDRTCHALGIPLVSGAVHGRQIQVVTRQGRHHVRSDAARKVPFFPQRPAEEQEGCDMRSVPASVTTIAAALMAMRIADLVGGGHGHAGMMDLVDTEHGRWMRIMGPDAGEFMDTPVQPMRHV